MSETVITNVTVVTRDDAFEGTVVFNGTGIREVSPGGTSVAAARDGEGDILAPGLIEMHTDNVEKHVEPRPGVHWPSTVSALMAHDTQMAGAGVTTVYDAISVGDYQEDGRRKKMLKEVVDGLHHGIGHGLFRAEHRLHLRCEISDEHVIDMFEPLVEDPLVRLVSLMDHTPGQRQWRDLQAMRTFHSRRKTYTDEEFEAFISDKLARQREYSDRHRERVLELWAPRGLPLASHDDTTVEHVDDAYRDGIRISEFPTTLEAARRADELGMHNIMGSPNLVRGGSHSGNVSAGELAENDVLHGLSSDYMPVSLLHAASLLHTRHGKSLPGAMATVTHTIADMLGLDDRGEIAPGKRADLVRFRPLSDGSVAVRDVWRDGRQVS